MKPRRLFIVLFLAAAAVAFSAGEGSMTVTTAAELWKAVTLPAVTKAAGTSFDIEVFNEPRQVIDGFGGCFNEKGWTALSLLSEEKRTEALKALFDPVTGAKFNICRVPIGASDYAMDRYTLDETKDDFDMKNFSIERDRRLLIPYVKAAMTIKPDLKIWGSVWTVPTWMKTNGAFDGGYMKDDPKVYAAYALYLAKFLEAYQKEGINAYAVAVQNEPKIETNYPSCLWTSRQFLAFIKDYIGPLFTSRGVKGEIWLATLQDGDYTDFPSVILSDKAANAYVSTVGFQWDGLASVNYVRTNYPNKKIYQTETECGNWHWKEGFDPDKPQNDWSYGVYTWNKVKAFISAGCSSYMLWNMVLDQEGKSIDAVRPWPQNAAIVVDTAAKSLIYTPMYYAFKHFSAFVEPGAFLLRSAGAWSDVLAFRNPDGKIVMVIQNNTSNVKPLSLKAGDTAVSIALPPKSWCSVKLP
jgi:glucosylceramidase